MFTKILRFLLRPFLDTPEKRARREQKRLAKLQRQFERDRLRREKEDAEFDSNQPETAAGLLDHLNDLRKMLIRVAIAVAIFASLGLLFAEEILKFLLQPYGEALQVTNPTESVSIFIRVGLSIGLALSSPFIVLEIIRFVAPALRPREARTLWLIVPGAFILFVIGASFAWFLMLPAAIDFLSSFLPDIFSVDWKADEYVPFVLSLTLWIGISFEMPMVAYALAFVGLATPPMLIKGWRFAIIGAALVAAAITPTVDPFNMLLVMAPLLVLYGLSILVTIPPYRARQRRAEYERLLEQYSNQQAQPS